MSKYKYSEEQQKMNNILKYQDEQLKELNIGAEERRNKLDAEIEVMESQLRSIGIDPSSVKRVDNPASPKKLLVYPSWERMCAEAENVVGSHCDLESIFTEEELKN